MNLKSALSPMEQSPDKYTAEDSDGLGFVAKDINEQLCKQGLENGTVLKGWKE